MSSEVNQAPIYKPGQGSCSMGCPCQQLCISGPPEEGRGERKQPAPGSLRFSFGNEALRYINKGEINARGGEKSPGNKHSEC